MELPVSTDLAAMEAQSVASLPEESGWQYEPKWDGFRCLAFRDRDEVDLRSKAGQPLARYFPELVAAVRTARSNRFAFPRPAGGPASRAAVKFRNPSFGGTSVA